MSHRAAATTATLVGRVSVYLQEDRVEVGQMNLIFLERLSRVAHRDARRMVAWPDRRPGVRWVGWAVLAASVLAMVVAAAAGFEGAGLAILSILCVTMMVLAGLLLYSGRRGGLTRFRIEGVRGHVEGVLSGRRRKREELLARIEERIRERQRPSSSA